MLFTLRGVCLRVLQFNIKWYQIIDFSWALEAKQMTFRVFGSYERRRWRHALLFIFLLGAGHHTMDECSRKIGIYVRCGLCVDSILKAKGLNRSMKKKSMHDFRKESKEPILDWCLILQVGRFSTKSFFSVCTNKNFAMRKNDRANWLCIAAMLFTIECFWS